mmetsp:Transcript_14900/g.33806  ORF Transcript_14900/g.33806 Transcript_14900/m.33806 type:complete len:87 (-) Transcript_14900:158-418(-)
MAAIIITIVAVVVAAAVGVATTKRETEHRRREREDFLVEMWNVDAHESLDLSFKYCGEKNAHNNTKKPSTTPHLTKSQSMIPLVKR